MIVPLKRRAKTAGLLYLLLAITSIFGLVYVPSQLVVKGDVMTTLQNIQNARSLYRLGLISNLIYLTVFVFLVFAFYDLLKEVSKSQARLMVAFVLVGVPIAFLNELNKIAVQLLIDSSSTPAQFDKLPRDQMAHLFLNLYEHGSYMVTLYWGLWLFPLGNLIVKSGFIPKVLGYLLIVGCVGYLVTSITFLISPVAGRAVFSYATIPSAIAEVSLIAWLLVKGVKENKSEHNL